MTGPWDQERLDYEREDQRNDEARDLRYEMDREATEYRESLERDLRGDHDSPYSYYWQGGDAA